MNNNYKEIEQVNDKKLWIRNYFLSILFHFLLLVIFLFLYNWNNEQSKINSVMFSLDTKEYLVEKSIVEDEVVDEQKNVNSEQISETIEELK